jgi:hypothetical protein
MPEVPAAIRRRWPDAFRWLDVEARGLAPFFQLTVNDYEAEGFEPGLPPLDARIAAFRALADRYGRERVVWRFDPLLLSDSLSAGELLRRTVALGERLHAHAARLVISFADIQAYARWRRRCAAARAGLREFRPDERAAFARGLAPHLSRWGLTAATCCEADDLSACGIAHSACVDAREFLRLGLLTPDETASVSKKDPGQRRGCRCTLSKDIGAYRTCTQGGVYCYA